MKRAVAVVLCAAFLASCSHAGTNSNQSGKIIPPIRAAGVGTNAPFPSMIHMIPAAGGSGPSGAEGPRVAGVPSNVGIPPSVVPRLPEQESPNVDAATYGIAPNVITGDEASFDAATAASQSASIRRAAKRTIRPSSITIGAGFFGDGDQDLSAATNGTYIVSTDAYGDLYMYGMTGSLIKYVPWYSTLYCGTNPLPICSTAGQPGDTPFAADDRIAYDNGSGRWITSGLWLYAQNTVPTDVLAVSQTSDPTGLWNVYQFPSCGVDQHIVNNTGNSDQPHLGFNSQWVVVTSACNNTPCTSTTHQGCSLAVFDKAALYSGATLSLNTNWFEFADAVENAANRDNPASTYGPTINNREYLTASAISNGNAEVIYSHIEGSTDAPVFYSSTDAVVTSFPASSVATVSTPTCAGCMTALSNGWTHSSGVWTFKNGHAYILSTMILGDPSAANANQVDAVAISDGGVATSMRITGGTGYGPMGSEIVVPLVNNLGDDFALLGIDLSSPTFYPGLLAAQWDVDLNRLSFLNTVAQGSFMPSGSDPGRWLDYAGAVAPIPGSSNVLVGGQVAHASNGDPERAIYYTTIAGAATPTPAPTPSPRPLPSPTCKTACL